MRNLRIRCSALGQIMTSPTAAAAQAGEVLSVGAKTAVRKLAREAIFGIEPRVTSRPMEKGIRCEQEAIYLYNSVFGTRHAKNAERKTDEYLTGECDIAADPIIDIKIAWSLDSFPIVQVDAVNDLYEWQLRGYMRLWQRPKARVAYCLIDTPEDLIGYEAHDAHRVSHLPDHLRVTTWDFERDAEKEALIETKVKAAAAYYAEVIAEFDLTHQQRIAA